MRQRLIEAATLVFAEMGPEVAQIDDVIRQAGVSRGTFYNYFRSTDELLRAAVHLLSVEMVALVYGAGDDAAQPAERFADGIKAFVDLATRHPLLLDFVSRLGVSTLGSDVLTPALAAERMVDVIAPEAAGDLSPNLARGIVEAATLALLLRVRAGAPVDIAGFVAAMLRALGHPPPEAARLAARPFTPLTIPTDSLIVRSESARSEGAELGRKPG
jgi:AcrR family transcriptional regulator